MSSDQVVATWVFMTLTRLRRRLGLSTRQLQGFALEHELVGFLYANHELLHLYDDDVVCDDVVAHVTERTAVHAG